jgi:hypothetical protein
LINPYQEELDREQEIINRIKNSIIELPDFANTTEENKSLRIYAVLELAFDVTDDHQFIKEAFSEVSLTYVEKIRKNKDNGN